MEAVLSRRVLNAHPLLFMDAFAFTPLSVHLSNLYPRNFACWNKRRILAMTCMFAGLTNLGENCLACANCGLCSYRHRSSSFVGFNVVQSMSLSSHLEFCPQGQRLHVLHCPCTVFHQARSLCFVFSPSPSPLFYILHMCCLLVSSDLRPALLGNSSCSRDTMLNGPNYQVSTFNAKGRVDRRVRRFRNWSWIPNCVFEIVLRNQMPNFPKISQLNDTRRSKPPFQT